jgi:aldose 1-epimerase
MTDTIVSLSAFGFDLDIAPEAGGGIAGLSWRGLPVLRPAREGAVAVRDPLGLSCFPMTPYASRIVDGAFTWGNVTTAIPANMTGGSHPLHGIGWRNPWRVLEHSDSHIELELRHEGDASWPWAFETRQIFRLLPNALEMTLSVESLDARPFPASLGPHPYFLSQDASIQFSAESLWETTGEALPSHTARPPVVDQLSESVKATVLDLDHCFEGWNGRAQIDWPSHGVVIEAAQFMDEKPVPCTRLQLYTPPSAGFFCLEPVTARGVAFTAPDPMALGVVELGRQRLSITTRLTPFLR